MPAHPKSLSSMSTAALLCVLGGCGTPAPQPWRVEPVMQVSHSTQTAEAYYRLGRYHDGAQAWEAAVEAYGKAIAADPAHVEAYNALGVAWARLGRHAAAESALRRGLQVDPLRAHLHSNLGYVLLLAGRKDASVAALHDALRLDPSDAVARGNLAQAVAVAAAPATPSIAPLPAPRAGEAASTAATAPALQVDAAPTVAAWPKAGDASPPASPAQAAVMPAAVVQLELSNGGGVAGAAARTRQWLAGQGLPTHRLTNQRPFHQRDTVVQYRAGHEAAAQRVARTLGVASSPQAAPGLTTDVRVVLGRDLHRLAACLDGCGMPGVRVAGAGE